MAGRHDRILRPEPMVSGEMAQLIKALIRGFEFTVSLLRKVLTGEKV